MRKKILFLLFLFVVVCASAQTHDTVPRPNYRLGKNLPKYDPSLFPLGTVKTATGTWTELNPNIPTVDYIGISFYSKDTGWSVGAQGAVIYTTNCGGKWNWSPTPTPANLFAVHSYNGKTVIACGSWGAIIRSTDGGRTWNNIVSGVTTNLWSVQMLDDSLGWICGVGPVLLKTTNGGVNWQQVQTGVNNFSYWSLSFSDKQHGIIGGDYGCLLKTVNGGSTWEYIYVGGGTFLYSVKALDSLFYVVGGPWSSSEGRVLYTTNGGLSFTKVYSSLPFNSIACATDSAWSIVGDDGLACKTTNRGGHWYYLSNLGNNCVTFSDPQTGFICGEQVKISKSTNGGFEWKKSVINDDFFDTYFFKNGTGFALGDYLYKTTDYGNTWENIRQIGTGRTITFYDSLTGVISRAFPLWNYYTTDGGLNWTQSNIFNYDDDNYQINKFVFYNRSLGYAGAKVGILKTTDGGKNWYGILNNTNNVSGLFLFDSLNIWSVGTKIFKTSDGGMKWEQQTFFGFPTAFDIHFTDNRNGWIINKDKYLCRTTNRGESWITIDGPINLVTMQWLDSKTGITVSSYPYYNNLYKTDDGGWLWHFIPRPPKITGVFRKHFLNSKHEIFAVSGSGCIYRYTESLLENTETQNFDIKFILGNNYPNPFNASTKITYTVPRRGRVIIKVYNIEGMEINELQNEDKEAGTYECNFYAGSLSSGVYFYRLQYQGKYEVKAMTILK